MSAAAERFVVEGGEEQLLQQHPMYHVPQHSRREKLRFPPEDSPPPTSLLLLHDATIASPLYPTNTLASFLPPSSSSSSSSSSTYYSSNANYNIASSTQFSGRTTTLSLPTHHHHHQISNQGFSLSLSSSPSNPPPPPRHQSGVGINHGVPRSPGPLGPFTGYATVLNRSRFLEPARQLLEEICGAGRRAVPAAGGSSADDMLLDADPPVPSPMDHRMEMNDRISSTEQQWKKARLISILDEPMKRLCENLFQLLLSGLRSSFGALSNSASFSRRVTGLQGKDIFVFFHVKIFWMQRVESCYCTRSWSCHPFILAVSAGIIGIAIPIIS